MRRSLFVNKLFQTVMAAALAIVTTSVSATAQATELDIAQSPLFLSMQLAPNVVLTLDDSGSMAYAYAPDSIGGEATECTGGWWNQVCTLNPKFASSTFNSLYYDPNTTYTPPVDQSGTSLTTSFTAAYINGFAHDRGTVDLSTNYKVTVSYNPSDYSNNDVGSGEPAFYYVYDPADTACSSVSKSNSDCYKKVVVTNTSGPDGKNGLQNFANWYSFYRTRNLATVTAASLAMQEFGGEVRVAWQALNSSRYSDTPCDSLTTDRYGNYDCQGWAGHSYNNGIAKFKDVLNGLQHRSDFYNWLFHLPAVGGTPLRAALDRAGELYTTAGKDSPYAEDPQVEDGTEYACRQNYSIIMTDGLWNGDEYINIGKEVDNSQTLPDGTTYTPHSPYKGGHRYSDSHYYTPSLADIAFHYWSHDLRPDLKPSGVLKYTPVDTAESVTDSQGNTASLSKFWNPKNDPATWQHMVTFTVGLGLNSYLTHEQPPFYDDTVVKDDTGDKDVPPPTYRGDYAGLVTGSVDWPQVYGTNGMSEAEWENVSDLWHAAIVSRGQFFGADQPNTLVKSFTTIIKRIQNRSGSASAIAVNSTSLQTNTLIFQGVFNPKDWSGELNAFPIAHGGKVDQASATWQASAGIPDSKSRNIFTYNPTAGNKGGIPFLWDDLTIIQQNDLRTHPYESTLDDEDTGKARLKYLRGDDSNGSFRKRSTKLGDVINSDPFYVGSQNYGDSLLPGAAGDSYPAWLKSKESRTSAVYFGANDGMLHAFNAKNGQELFAFIPNALFPNLSKLTSTDYIHHYYVDGGIMAIDAYVDTTNSGSKTWHTILVGSTGAGARDIFALDVSKPATFDASDVLWELSGSDDSDLGYVLGSPIIARLNSGQWVAVFGNGYNSTAQHAVLFVVDLATGKTLRKIDTGVGTTTRPNGLAQPVPVDTDGDRITDVVYAGDLYGNLWKFDLSDPDKANWKIAYENSDGTPAPLFHAADGTEDQPITSAPAVGRDDDGNLMIFFGTGKYFEKGDEVVGANPPTQTLYGIKDLGSAVTKDELLHQVVLGSDTVNTYGLHVTSQYDITTEKGWYLDLPGKGERIVNEPIFRYGRIIYTSTVPNNDACKGGGTSWIWELNASSGARLDISPFDVSDDKQFTEDDYAEVTYVDSNGKTQTITVAASAKQSKNGLNATPAVLDGGGTSSGDGPGIEYKLTSGTRKQIEVTVESSGKHGGRFSWRQIH